MSRASTPLLRFSKQGVDGRDKPGHDGEAFRRGEHPGEDLSNCSAALLYSPSMNRIFLEVERSATGRAWRDRLDERGAARALAIAQRHELPELLARVLAGRGVEVEEAARYLDPTVRELMPDPNVLSGMAAAAARLADAVARTESVAILGDYDVDGATAAATLARYLHHCGLA